MNFAWHYVIPPSSEEQTEWEIHKLFCHADVGSITLHLELLKEQK
nr:hypothetical protein [uncultured Flavobacterium sp.]